MEGELLKWDESSHNWKKIYCVIKENILNCYPSLNEKNDEVEELKIINLSQCSISSSLTSSLSQFSLELPNILGCWTFKASDSDIKQKWINAFESRCKTKAKVCQSENRGKVKGLIQKQKSSNISSCQSLIESKVIDQIVKKPIKKSHDIFSFFGTRGTTFGHIKDYITRNEDQIPFIPFSTFIKACLDYSQLFDRLENTVLLPVKTDMLNNINILEENFKSATLNTDLLLLLVKQEVNEGKHLSEASSTQTLLWLCRTLWSINIFSMNITDEGSATYKKTTASLVDAYNQVLLRHHNWLSQKFFKTAMKFVSSYETLVKKLTEEECQNKKLSFDQIEKLFIVECLSYNQDLSFVLDKINFYCLSVGIQLL